MKKLLVVAVAVTMVLMAASAYATIANSKHDLSNANTTAGVIKADNTTLSSCQFCHTPHNGMANAGAPLWNRSLPTGGGYTFYASAAGSTTVFNSIGANSKTCLSCHDGTISIGNVNVGADGTFTAVANRVDGSGMLTGTNPALIGTDLTNDHPVGFLVDTNKAGLVSIATMTGKGARFYGAAGSERMECATCHDPHNTNNGKFLRWSSGTMCSDCHNY